MTFLWPLKNGSETKAFLLHVAGGYYKAQGCFAECEQITALCIDWPTGCSLTIYYLSFK